MSTPNEQQGYPSSTTPKIVRDVLGTGGPVNYKKESTTGEAPPSIQNKIHDQTSVTSIPVPGHPLSPTEYAHGGLITSATDSATETVITKYGDNEYGYIPKDPAKQSIDLSNSKLRTKVPENLPPVRQGSEVAKHKPSQPSLFSEVRNTICRLLEECVRSDTLSEREKIVILSEARTFSETILKERFGMDL